ncbi:MAG TPA: thioredoxin [Bacteroidales bacterium]|nr:thioredoxin [Bacteroidales bacterium]
MKTTQIIIGIGLLLLPLVSCKSQTKDNKPEQKEETTAAQKSNIEHLTAASFKQKVFDYEKHKDWKYAGDKPAIIDFYADWCGPCRIVAPTVAQIAEEYKGKVNVYKVNVDNEQELASVFGISGIPAILFIPMTEQPQLSAGVINKEAFDKAIKNVLKVD